VAAYAMGSLEARGYPAFYHTLVVERKPAGSKKHTTNRDQMWYYVQSSDYT